jgi:hypothetical protein
MAERFDEIPQEVMLASRGGSGKYPWSEWLDGGAWALKEGEDFTVKAESFISTCHSAANQRGMKLVARRDGKGTIWIQAKQRLPRRGRPPKA